MALHYIILFLVFLKAVTFLVQSRHSSIEEDSVILSHQSSHPSSTSAVLKKPARYNMTVELLGWSIGISMG
jgi:hypothetical protein